MVQLRDSETSGKGTANDAPAAAGDGEENGSNSTLSLGNNRPARKVYEA